ncbi:transferrin-like [Ctenocephalides felis]|uniref:transferrin-like n=1 Tax=Ctenocephalides felis TaxID=7515 RepID=UPI000E6E3FCF|nr:transferrin-like [Ctenocephalides felis]
MFTSTCVTTVVTVLLIPFSIATHTYKMCVPETAFRACQEMSQVVTQDGATMECIEGRDRIECLDKIIERQADFAAVDPEDMYVAYHLPNQDFEVIKEIRTKDEPQAEFRYEGVAVIHKNLDIANITGLRGLNSCHTGIGRNVGYKIPLTKLRKLGLIGPLNDNTISPRENELKAFSGLFKQSCIVGQWSPDPTIDAKLKKAYSNLCELCEHPEKCDYPDLYSGYDGALRCLAHNGGQVAFTKVIYVRKFFGLPVGVLPATHSVEDHTKFAYLCPDGSKRDIDGPACSWAARPWQGFVANADVHATVQELRNKLKQLDALGDTEESPKWFASVLLLNNKTLVADNDIISPQEYLTKAKYVDVIERDVGTPRQTIRFCVTSEIALKKCRELRKSAYSRDIRPAYDCVLAANERECMKTISENGADVITLQAGLALEGKSKFNLRPILSVQWGGKGSSYWAVAIVRKDSAIQSFADLRGKKSCHGGYTPAGYIAPVHVLLKQGLISKETCPRASALIEFFEASCLPGSLNRSEGKDFSKLCSACKNPDKCLADFSEEYFGHNGAFRCLAEGHGDVAFVPHVTVKANTDGGGPNWAHKFKSEDYELLCPNGGRKSLEQFEECHLVKIPLDMVMTSNTKTENEVDAIKHALISTAELYTERPDLFKLFGSFKGKGNLLFPDDATGLEALEDSKTSYTEYQNIVKEIMCS